MLKYLTYWIIKISTLLFYFENDSKMTISFSNIFYFSQEILINFNECERKLIVILLIACFFPSWKGCFNIEYHIFCALLHLYFCMYIFTFVFKSRNPLMFSVVIFFIIIIFITLLQLIFILFYVYSGYFNKLARLF